MIGKQTGPDRAVSISITHVLTIAITTILIAMLMTSAGTMLDTETERSAESSLETIGERLADEIGNVDQIGTDTADDVTLTTDHPRTVANSRYTVELLDSDAGGCDAPLLDGDTDCLKLTAHSTDTVVYVPVKVDASTDIASGSTATGGPIEIRYDGGANEISITEGQR